MLAAVVSFTSCEKTIEPDPTAPGRMIFQQTRQHLMTPVTVLDLALAFNEYYLAPTDKMRDDVEDKYFADYKIRYDEVSQMWRLERSNNPVVRIKMEGGKSLSEMGGKWHFYPGRTDFSGDSAISVEYKAAGVYVVNFNNLPSYSYNNELVLSGNLEMTPSNRTTVFIRGSFNFASTKDLYKVSVQTYEEGLTLDISPSIYPTDINWYNNNNRRTPVRGEWGATVKSSTADKFDFNSLTDSIWRITYTTADGNKYMGNCNSSGQKLSYVEVQEWERYY
jgi:hypothetical protein